jgi:HlyD family secretion protein
MPTAADTFPGHPELGPRVRWRPLLVALLLLVALVVVLRRASAPAEPAVRYETAEVQQGPLQAKVTATGTLSALVTVQVGSQVSGRVSEILVDFNAPVARGQVIARLDPMLFRAAVEQARANDAAARANLEKARVQRLDARRQARRMAMLRARRLVAQSEVDTAVTAADVAASQVVAADAAVEQARAALNQALINLDYTTILSPIDGVVISRNVDVGQTVAASLQAPTLFVIAEDLRRMQVDSSVAEADVGKLAPGMLARFTVDAHPSITFVGIVRQIRNAAQTVQNVVTYDAVIDVDNPDLLLRPGMTANITVIHAERTDAVLLPNAALRFRPPAEWSERAPRLGLAGDLRRVWTLRDGAPVPLDVRVGVTDGTRTELVEGALQPGDALVTEVVQTKKSGPGSFGRVL